MPLIVSRPGSRCVIMFIGRLLVLIVFTYSNFNGISLVPVMRLFDCT